ncbi:MAG: type II toxin-antitoxin system VapC family toxin [Terriglobales bacterium]|jgi:tRNA(fMet)-specific endonuclease VapC
MILLDSNTLIYYIRGVEPVVKRFQAANRSELAIPSMAAYEIEYGALKSGSTRRKDITKELLAGVIQVPFDASAASEAAVIRIELERRGLVIGPLDLMIAGSARSRDAVLITSNTREFSRVKNLTVQDWML